MAYFLAVIPHELKDNSELRRLFSKFKRTMDDKGKEVRWVPSDLWHVTVQFLGDLSGEQKKSVVDFFESWEPTPEWKNIELRVQGVGAFPEVDHARVLWLGIQKNQSLLDAQASLQQDLANLNIATDEREYTPHLTLARFRNPLSATDLVKLGGRKHFGDYAVAELILLESVVQGKMTKYIPVLRKNLQLQ